MRRFTGSALLLALLVAGAGVAHAQTTVVSNPTTLTFEPSLDHDAVLGDGRAAVEYYLFNVYSVGAAAPFHSTSIGKPAPAGDGLIQYLFAGDVPAWALPGGTYEARVEAVGPNGRGLSEPSNPFTFSACSYSLTGTAALVPAAGGGTSIGVTTGSGCGWTAASNAPWVALNPTGGTGSASVIATVAANTGTAARSATLTVAGRTFTVNQEAAACTFTLSAASASFGAAGGTGTVGVTTSAGCAWTSSSPASWVGFSAGSGTGSATATYSVGANAGAARATTLTIAGKTFTVSQSGAAAPPPAPTAPSAPSPASGSTGISLTPALTWTASGATSYTVRFGTSNPPPQVAAGLAVASWSPGTLTASRTYYWQVVAVSATGSTAGAVWSFTTGAAPLPSGPLPEPWRGRDVGSVGLAGSESYSNGVFTITGSGADVWGTADSFRLVYRSLGPRTQIVARLTAEQCSNPGAKAGITMRTSTSSSSAHVSVFARKDGSVELITRSASGGQTTFVAGTTQSGPVWLRLVKSGSTITASVSANGSTWRTVGSARLTLYTSAAIGLAVTSRDRTLRNTGTFDNVTVR